MAVALEVFSIREYVAKTRSVNFEKCWPFDGDGGGEKNSSLPPISFRKFRWWSDELKVVQSIQAGGETEREKAGEDKAVRGSDELMAEIPAIESPLEEEREIKVPGRAKQRAAKKRSIVELFAVAPPIETVGVEADDDDGEDEEEEEMEEDSLPGREVSDAPRKRKGRVIEDEKKAKIRKKKWMKEKIRKKKWMNEKILKKKKMKLKVEVCAAKKEKIHKPKLPSSVHIFHTLQDSMHKKGSGKTSKNPVDSRKKPTHVKNLPKRRNFKLLQTSKLISKNRREVGKVLPVHSILKNPTRGNVKKASTKGVNLIKFCCESAKHVTFSGEDDILGHNKSCLPTELPRLQSLCKIFSDVLTASSALDNSFEGDILPAATDGVQVENVSDMNVSTSDVERRDGSLSENKQLSDFHGHAIPPMYTYPSNSSSPNAEKTSLAVSVDLNHAMQGHSDLNHFNPGTSTLMPSDRHSGEPRVLNSIHSEGLNSRSDIHVKETFPRTSDARFLPTPIEKCVSRSDTTGSLTLIRNPSPRHSTSSLVMSMEENGRQPQLPAEPEMDFCCRFPEYQPMHHLSSKDLMESLCSSVGSRLTSHPVSTCKDKCVGEDLIGLPLNSQGELIQLHSATKFGFNELRKKQQSSIHCFPVPNYAEPRSSVDHLKILKGKFPGDASNQKDQSSWFQEQYCPVSKPVTSGFGFTNLQGFDRLEVQNSETLKDKDKFYHRDRNPMDVSSNGCRGDNHTHKYNDRVKLLAEGNLHLVSQPVIQQTMRLMGKNVTVGRSDKECQGSDDGRIWTDKEVITDHCPSVRVSDKPLPKQWSQKEWVARPASERSKDNLFQPLEASCRFNHMPIIEPRSGLMHFDYSLQWMSRSGVSSTTGNHDLKVNLFSDPLPPQALLNKTSTSTVNSNSGIFSVKSGQQIPMVASNPPNIYQHMLLSSTQCKHSQGVSYSTSSTVHPPFLYQDLGSSAQPSPTHSSSNLPQWLLNAKQQKKNQESPCSCCSDPVAVHHHRRLSGTNLFTVPSPCPTSMIPFPVYTTNTSQRCGSSAPTVVQPSLIPACTASNLRYTVDNTCRNKNKNREGTNLKFTYLKGLNNAGKTRKRPAAKYDGFMKPAKKPFLKMHEDLNASAGPKGREQMHRYTQYNDKIVDMDHPVMVNEKEGFRTVSGSGFLKLDGGSRPGLIKLSAGAKHTLKPSQGMEHDNSRPIHTSTPFSIGNTSGKVIAPQKKTAKVYRF